MPSSGRAGRGIRSGWIVGRYFGKFNKFRNDRWVFGDRDSGACLVKFSWTAIERHVPVKGAASPDDPALASYSRILPAGTPRPPARETRASTCNALAACLSRVPRQVARTGSEGA